MIKALVGSTRLERPRRYKQCATNKVLQYFQNKSFIINVAPRSTTANFRQSRAIKTTLTSGGFTYAVLLHRTSTCNPTADVRVANHNGLSTSTPIPSPFFAERAARPDLRTHLLQHGRAHPSSELRRTLRQQSTSRSKRGTSLGIQATSQRNYPALLQAYELQTRQCKATQKMAVGFPVETSCGHQRYRNRWRVLV